jgi:hypothetical protein
LTRGKDCAKRRLRGSIDALAQLPARRGRFVAWKYYYAYAQGSPPWMSGMTQATAVQALSRAARALHAPRFARVARRALGAFETPPPTGVAVAATGGTHYLMYSYAPQLFIFNGFLQSLVGLDVYGDLTGDLRGGALFRAGHGNAKAIVPLSDTGTWSLYSIGGPESTVEYHTLLRDILGILCRRQGNAVYCDHEARFTQYLAQRTG